MSLRQAACSFLRRNRYSSQSVTANSFSGRANALIQAGKKEFCQYGFGRHAWNKQHEEFYMWVFLSGQAVILGMNSSPVLAEDDPVDISSDNDMQGANSTGLRKIEDGSVISNIHTSKWRVFTDNGRDLFLQGKLKEAEKFFSSALQEAKEGFGERDPHVASACNNLAELYRVKKAFEKAEPLYLEAVKILEEAFGPEDIRVGAALHNLGQFYLVQRKLDEAHMCYERALKIKKRVLGYGHTDYADTMYHLGTVLYLQGKEKDAVTLIQDSVRILEEGGLGESSTFLRRLRYLAQIYIKSNQLAEAENVQRMVLHIVELSKGWNSLDTVIAAENLGLTLQSAGNLTEVKDLLERCLEARKTILPEGHIQIASNMLHLARVEMLNANRLRKMNTSEADAERNKARDHLDHSIRIAQQVLYKSAKQKDKQQHCGVSKENRKDEHTALLLLLQSLNGLGLLEINKQEQLKLRVSINGFVILSNTHVLGENLPAVAAEKAYRQCISAFKEFGTRPGMSGSPALKAEYLSCLKHLSSLISNSTTASMHSSKRALTQELKEEIERVEGELSVRGKRKN